MWFIQLCRIVSIPKIHIPNDLVSIETLGISIWFSSILIQIFIFDFFSRCFLLKNMAVVPPMQMALFIIIRIIHIDTKYQPSGGSSGEATETALRLLF